MFVAGNEFGDPEATYFAEALEVRVDLYTHLAWNELPWCSVIQNNLIQMQLACRLK